MSVKVIYWLLKCRFRIVFKTGYIIEKGVSYEKEFCGSIIFGGCNSRVGKHVVWSGVQYCRAGSQGDGYG